MGKRMLSKLIYPCLKLYWFLVRPKTFGVKCVIQHRGMLLLKRMLVIWQRAAHDRPP